jgi:hypothetical protein
MVGDPKQELEIVFFAYFLTRPNRYSSQISRVPSV